MKTRNPMSDIPSQRKYMHPVAAGLRATFVVTIPTRLSISFKSLHLTKERVRTEIGNGSHLRSL